MPTTEIPILEFTPTPQMPTYHSVLMNAVREGQKFQIKKEEYVKHLLADYPRNFTPGNKRAKQILDEIKNDKQVAEIVTELPSEAEPQTSTPEAEEALPPPVLPGEDR